MKLLVNKLAKSDITEIPNYIPSLDGVRAIAVMLVLVSHSGFGHIVPGGFGVSIFFFLSGYLITTLLEKEFGGFGTINLKNFFIRRFYRLFPLLFATLTLGYVITYLGLVNGKVSIDGFLYQLFYLANYNEVFEWTLNTPDELDILWSLAVEEHFYLFFPALYLLVRKYLSADAIVVVIYILCIAILMWRFQLVYGFGESNERTYYATDTRIDSILYGCFFALRFNPLTKYPRLNRATFDKKFFFFILIGSTLVLVSLIYRDEGFRETARYAIQGIGIMPFFYYAIAFNGTKLFSWLNSKWLTTLGIYSYSIYLIHHLVAGFIEKQEITQNVFVKLLLVTSTSIFFAYIYNKYAECHFKRIRLRYRTQKLAK